MKQQKDLSLFLGVAYPVDSKDLEACDCKSNGYENEPDLDYRCDICDGEGYLFDDEVVVGYKMIQFQITDTEPYHAWGKNTVSRNLIYLESHELPSRFDKIIEPVIDEDGFVQTPIRLLRRHNIHQAEWLRADNGRLEYIRCACFED